MNTVRLANSQPVKANMILQSSTFLRIFHSIHLHLCLTQLKRAFCCCHTFWLSNQSRIQQRWPDQQLAFKNRQLFSAATICANGEVIFINRISVTNSPSSPIKASFLPGGEKATIVGCLYNSFFCVELNQTSLQVRNRIRKMSPQIFSFFRTIKNRINL